MSNKMRFYYRLSVLNGLFYVGEWRGFEPGPREQANAILERFKGSKLNGDAITWVLEKVYYIEEA